MTKGYVYLVKAEGFHGVLSPIKGRYKIGLTNNPERRLIELNGAQAPCLIIGLKYIEVENNALVEKELHQKFSSDRKYGEWFDFYVWQIPLVHIAYDRYAKGTVIASLVQYNLAKAGAICAIALIVAATSFAVTTSTNSVPRGTTPFIPTKIK